MTAQGHPSRHQRRPSSPGSSPTLTRAQRRSFSERTGPTPGSTSRCQVSDRLEGDFTAQDEANLVRL